MKRALICLTALGALAACSGEKADETAAPATEAAGPESAAPEDGAAPATGQDVASDAGAAAAGGSEPPFAVKAGDRLEVKKMADCVEFGPDADDVPWQMFPGVTVEYVAPRDGKAEVIGASGDHCMMAWDVLAPA